MSKQVAQGVIITITTEDMAILTRFQVTQPAGSRGIWNEKTKSPFPNTPLGLADAIRSSVERQYTKE